MKTYRPGPGTPVFLTRHGMPETKQWVPTLEAWIPEYVEGYGNGTIIYLDEAAKYVFGRTASAVFRSVAAYYFMDVTHLRIRYMELIGNSQSVPIPVHSRNLVFFAVKVRKPEIKNDGAIGYIANQRIQDYRATGSRSTLVTTKSGHELHLEMSIRNFEEQRRKAEYFAWEVFHDEGRPASPRNPLLRHPNDSFGSPGFDMDGWNHHS